MFTSAWSPFIFSFSLTAYLYFTFEIVVPYADEQEAVKMACEKENGIMLEINNNKLCLDKDIVITTYDN